MFRTSRSGQTPRNCGKLSTELSTPCVKRLVAKLVDKNDTPPTNDPTSGQSLNRQIITLALPALGALIAEPLLTTIDSAMVGHLGTAQLAGLSLASTVLMTAVGICVFLAYSTTAITSRALGAGKVGEGMQAGINAMWLAAVLGAALAAGFMIFARPLLIFFGADPQVLPHALDYLHYCSPGLVGMLVVLAATGTLRGALDTKTPLYVATGGAVVNAILNAILIYGLNLGVKGSAIGTALTQTLMAIVLSSVVVSSARQHHARFGFNLRAVWESTVAGFPLLLRSLTLRLAILATVWTIASAGTVALAAHQVVNTVWNFAAFALDALAIAAQALVGHALGKEDSGTANPNQIRMVVRKIVIWGIAAGTVIGVALMVVSPLLPWIFGTDPAMRRAATAGLLVAGLFQFLAGFVFIMDGILIGAGDNRYLALAGVINLVPYLPLLWFIAHLSTRARPLDTAGQTWVVVFVWAAFAVVFTGMRALTTGLRVRGGAWMHLKH